MGSTANLKMKEIHPVAEGLQKMKPLVEIPGSYGMIPFFSAIKDRLDFYWFQGDTEFFRRKMEQHKSTVFRMNYSPGPPGYPDPRGIALLDQKSFSVLLDNSKVDKTDTLLGPYMQSVGFTGGYRVLPYLDTTEEKHTGFKQVVFDLMRENSSQMIPVYHQAFEEATEVWERAVRESGKADVLVSADEMIIKFLLRWLVHMDPVEGGLGKDFRSTYQLWTGITFAGIAHTPLPHILEELLFHSFRLPPFLVRKQYSQIVQFYREHATQAQDMAEKLGLDREETAHQLVLVLGINARLGLLRMIPSLVYFLAKAGKGLQAKLAEEVRDAVGGSSEVSFEALKKMELVRSTVREALRLMPSIFYIYGRAREDLEIESHTSRFKVKKGELLGAHQYFVMRDPEVFEKPHEFVAERFMGEEGKRLLHYLVWSNGRDSEDPQVNDKQCPAKNVAQLITCQFLAEMFLKYDSFEITPDSKISTTEQDVYFKVLNKKPSA